MLPTRIRLAALLVFLGASACGPPLQKIGIQCAPPEGNTCPPTKGNCNGVGTPCTKGGDECKGSLSCDLALDERGKGFCITLFSCTPGKGECGTGATCCDTDETSNFAICLPNQCLPKDCKPEV